MLSRWKLFYSHWHFGKTVERFSKLDILVNNAAYQQTKTRLEDISDDEWDLTFRTNIFGYFYMAKAALKSMVEGATIINCGSWDNSGQASYGLDTRSAKSMVDSL